MLRRNAGRKDSPKPDTPAATPPVAGPETSPAKVVRVARVRGRGATPPGTTAAPPGARLPAPFATVVVVISGIVALVSYFVRGSFNVGSVTVNVGGLGDLLIGLVSLLLAFALFVGLANLLRVHLRRVGKRESGWPYSLVLLGSALATIIAGVVGSVSSNKSGLSGDAASWIFQNIYQPLGSTFYSLLAFFIATAAFRALRAHTVEVGIMAVVALIVVAGLAPISQLPELKSVADLGNWVLNYPAQAGVRGIAIGASLGVIATSLRVLLGIDRQYLG